MIPFLAMILWKWLILYLWHGQPWGQRLSAWHTRVNLGRQLYYVDSNCVRLATTPERYFAVLDAVLQDQATFEQLREGVRYHHWRTFILCIDVSETVKSDPLWQQRRRDTVDAFKELGLKCLCAPQDETMLRNSSKQDRNCVYIIMDKNICTYIREGQVSIRHSKLLARLAYYL